MNRTYHQEIFYPTRINFKQNESIQLFSKDNYHFIILPHASFNYIQDILQTAFNSIKGLNFDLITILSSLHRPLMDKDKSSFAVVRPKGKIENSQYSIPLVTLEEEGLCENEEYFIEESSSELTLPFLSHYFEDTPILEVLAYEYSLNLENLLEKIKSQNKTSLFIIMDNFTEKTEKNIQEPKNINYTINPNTLTPTSGIWLEAVKGSWEILKSYKKNYTYALAIRKEIL